MEEKELMNIEGCLRRHPSPCVSASHFISIPSSRQSPSARNFLTSFLLFFFHVSYSPFFLSLIHCFYLSFFNPLSLFSLLFLNSWAFSFFLFLFFAKPNNMRFDLIQTTCCQPKEKENKHVISFPFFQFSIYYLFYLMIYPK